MDRRNFLQLAALAIAGQAVVRTFPFRVYSVPKTISIVPHPFDPLFTSALTSPGACITPEMVRMAMKQMMAALGNEPLKVNYYPPLTSDFVSQRQ